MNSIQRLSLMLLKRIVLKELQRWFTIWHCCMRDPQEKVRKRMELPKHPGKLKTGKELTPRTGRKHLVNKETPPSSARKQYNSKEITPKSDRKQVISKEITPRSERKQYSSGSRSPIETSNRLYKQAEEITKKKQLLQQSRIPEFSFSPKITGFTGKWLQIKHEFKKVPDESIAVVSAHTLTNYSSLNRSLTPIL